MIRIVIFAANALCFSSAFAEDFWPKDANVYFIEPANNASLTGPVTVKLDFATSALPLQESFMPKQAIIICSSMFPRLPARHYKRRFRWMTAIGILAAAKPRQS